MVKSICIAGMHRSGTSLTASWVEKCGVSLDMGSVIEPSEWNVRGHFEDKSFVQFSDRPDLESIFKNYRQKLLGNNYDCSNTNCFNITNPRRITQ